MISRFILAVKKFFMLCGIIAVTMAGTVIYMKAGDTSPKVMAAKSKPMTKAEKIRAQEAANSGTLLTAVVMILCMLGAYVYLVRIKPKSREYPSRRVEAAPIKEVSISQSEYELIEEIESEWKGRYNAQDFATLIKSTPSYQGLHEYILVNFGLEWNYEDFRLIQKALDNKKLENKILNLTKTWTRNETSRKRDKTKPLGDFRTDPITI